MSHYIVKLTAAEAEQLGHVVTNGWDEGQWTERLGPEESRACARAVRKVREAWSAALRERERN